MKVVGFNWSAEIMKSETAPWHIIEKYRRPSEAVKSPPKLNTQAHVWQSVIHENAQPGGKASTRTDIIQC